MMMLDYKGGRRGQESGKKWLHNLNYVINYVTRKLYQTNLYFFYLNFFILCDISAEFHLNYT